MKLTDNEKRDIIQMIEESDFCICNLKNNPLEKNIKGVGMCEQIKDIDFVDVMQILTKNYVMKLMNKY